jgi:uncharacterized membrane protein YkoI
MCRMRRFLFVPFGFCLAISSAVFPVRAGGGDNDQDLALEALQRGEALSLSEVLARVEPKLGGEVIGVTFQRDRQRWVYEFTLVMPNGVMGHLLVDAKSGDVINPEAR